MDVTKENMTSFEDCLKDVDVFKIFIGKENESLGGSDGGVWKAAILKESNRSLNIILSLASKKHY